MPSAQQFPLQRLQLVVRVRERHLLRELHLVEDFAIPLHKLVLVNNGAEKELVKLNGKIVVGCGQLFI
jgi:hypothetical protein